MRKVKTEHNLSNLEENKPNDDVDDEQSEDDGDGDDDVGESAEEAEEEQEDDEEELDEPDDGDDEPMNDIQQNVKEKVAVTANALPEAPMKKATEEKPQPNDAPTGSAKSATGLLTKSSTPVMVDAAIRALNERQGSSVVAIKQYITSNYKITSEKSLSMQMKKYIKESIANGRMVQLKRSFKLTPQANKEDQQKEKMKAKKKTTKEKEKKLKVGEKGAKKQKTTKTKEQTAKTKAKDAKKTADAAENKENMGKKKTQGAAAKEKAAAPLKATTSSENMPKVGVKLPGKVTKKSEKPMAAGKKSAALQRKSIGSLIAHTTVGKKTGKKLTQPKVTTKKQLSAIAAAASEVATSVAPPAATTSNAAAMPAAGAKLTKKAKK